MSRHSKSKEFESSWQSGSLAVSLDDHQWENLCSLRRFRPQKQRLARQSVNAAIDRFIFRKALDLTPAALRKKMDSFGFGLKKLHPVFTELRHLNDIKQSLGSDSPYGSGRGAIGLANSLYDEFSQAAHKLLTAMENCIDEMPRTNRGPKNDSLVELVRELDDIVLTCSDSGPLNRSYKHRDVEFALAVLGIAEKKFKRKTNSGSVENAIKMVVRDRISSSKKSTSTR